MRGSWQRQTALTNNLANADTPGYKRQDVNFEADAAERHRGGQSPEEVQFQTETKADRSGPQRHRREHR